MMHVLDHAPTVNTSPGLAPRDTEDAGGPRAVRPAGAATTEIRARVLSALPGLDGRGAKVRIALIAAGFVPVTLIKVSTFGIVGLHALALGVLAPVVAAIVVLAVRRPALVRLIAPALVAGVIATAMYDLVRFVFIASHLVGPDPIPHIGAALRLHPAWVFGYLWRYLGNGGGLAIAFFGLGLRGVRKGILFGLFVNAGLIVTLIVSPRAQEVLFPLTVPSVVMVTIGHALFGAVLGAITVRRQTTHPAPVVVARRCAQAPHAFSSSP